MPIPYGKMWACQALVCRECGTNVAQGEMVDPVKGAPPTPEMNASHEGMQKHQADTGHAVYRVEMLLGVGEPPK